MTNLGRKLWRDVEAIQGYAYIADDVEDMPDDAVIRRATGALVQAEKLVKVLRRFVQKHRSETARTTELPK